MAQRVSVVYTDDLDNTEGSDVRTVQFGFLDASYEIDLGPANTKHFQDLIAPYVAAARKAGGTQRRQRVSRSNASRDRSGEIRKWARERGITISERGRIPGEVVAQYNAAQNAAPPATPVFTPPGDGKAASGAPGAAQGQSRKRGGKAATAGK